jgi:uncharacterized protein DUF5666
MKKLLLIFVLASATLAAQPQERQRMNMPPGETVVGKVTAVSKDSITVAPIMGGEPVTIKIGESTRVMKERQPAKLEDVKVDETVFARGKLNGNSMEAAVVGVVNPEMIQRLQQGGGPGPMSAFNREDLGKKFIAGEVKAINETRLTIARPDGQSQDIEVDENTSFRRGQESITLPEIKVGDFVRGPGELKENVFVARQLIVGRPQIRLMTGEPGGQGAPAGEKPGQKKPEEAPQTPPKQLNQF